MVDAHVHIERGPYTMEWIWSFVDYAGQRGITDLYLLEHSHRFREFGKVYKHVNVHDPDIGAYQRNWLGRKMQRSLDEYAQLIEEIRKEDFPISVYCGLEVCYFPGEEQEIAAVTSGYKWDFLTGAVHWIDGWGFDHPSTSEVWNRKDVDQVYRRYYGQVKDLIESDLFDHVAHPGSVKCLGYHPRADFIDSYWAIASAARKHCVKVEFNNGLRINYGHSELGLNRDLLACLQQEGIEIVTASDAHKPEDVGLYIDEAERIIGRHGASQQDGNFFPCNFRRGWPSRVPERP